MRLVPEDFQNTRILIVEDELIIARGIRKRLLSMGYDVSDIVSTGEEAVRMADEEPPGLILMDINLGGGMDGIQAAERIRSNHDIPVIYLTAYRDAESLGRAKITEPYGYIVKPFQDENLQSAIEMALYKHRMESRLRRSEQWLATTLQCIGDAVVTTDVEGTVTYMNPVAESLTGWSRDEALGRRLEEVTRFRDKTLEVSVPDMVSRVVREGKLMILAGDAGLLTKTGRFVPVEAKATPIKGNKGMVMGLVLVIFDITEQRRVEEALRKAKEVAEGTARAKSQFLANMSHELRTPMTGILGMLRLALEEDLTPVLREYLLTTFNSSRSLMRILNDILDMSKIGAEKLVIEEKPFSLRKCLTEALDIMKPEVRRKGLDFDVSVDESAPDAVVGDQARLRQVLINLVSNAIKFTDNGKVAVTVTIDGVVSGGRRRFVFEVTDTGIGIPDDKQELLFQAFSQIDSTHGRKYGGTGLGLAICKELVGLMGGTISFISKEGAGSIFSFAIPLGEAAPELVDRGAVEPLADDALPCAMVEERPPRLLLAEDDPASRRVLELIFKRYNYQLDVAEDGRQVVEMWEKGDYDLVLMDIQMPGLNGFEATLAIREKERQRGGHTPIVAMTAHALEGDRDAGFAAGMDDYLPKPIDFQKCLRLIGRIIRRKSPDSN